MPKSLGEMLDRVLQNVKTQSVMDAAEPFDPRPFQSAFLTLLKELMEQNIEVTKRLKSSEREVQQSGRLYGEQLTILENDIAQLETSFNTLETTMRSISQIAVQVGGQLEIADQVREEASLARDTLFYFSAFQSGNLDFRCDGTREPLSGKSVLPAFIRSCLDPSQPTIEKEVIQAADVVQRLQSLTTTLDEETPGRQQCIEFCTLFEQRLLDRFARNIREGDAQSSRSTVSALYRLKSGNTCITNYLKDHHAFCKKEWPPSLVGFCEQVYRVIKDELDTMKSVFPNYRAVFHLFVHRMFENVVSPYVSSYLIGDTSKGEYLNRLRDVHRNMGRLTTLLTPLYTGVPTAAPRRQLGSLFVVPEHSVLTKVGQDMISTHLAGYFHAEREYLVESAANELCLFIEARDTLLTKTKFPSWLPNHDVPFIPPPPLMSNVKKSLLATLTNASDSSKSRLSLLSRRFRNKGEKNKKKEDFHRRHTTTDETGEISLNLEIALNILHTFESCVTRCKELSDPIDVSERVHILLLDMLDYVCHEYLYEALYILSALQLPQSDSPKAAKWDYLATIQIASTLAFKIRQVFSTSVMSILDPVTQTECLQDLDKILSRSEEVIIAALTHLIHSLCMSLKKILERDQKKYDFCPKEETDVGMTAACSNACALLRSHYAALMLHLDGDNVASALDILGERLLVLLLRHFRKFQYNAFGAFRLKSDIGEYYAAMNGAWNGTERVIAPALKEQWEVLLALPNLYTVAPSNVSYAISNSALTRLPSTELEAFLKLRTDYEMGASVLTPAPGRT